MIERLFAQQGQGGAFLMMLLGGLAVGAAAWAGTLARRRWAWLGVPADILLAGLLLIALLAPMFLLDTPLRLYGLLGLSLGGALWLAGIAPLVEGLIRIMKKSLRRRRKSSP